MNDDFEMLDDEMIDDSTSYNNTINQVQYQNNMYNASQTSISNNNQMNYSNQIEQSVYQNNNYQQDNIMSNNNSTSQVNYSNQQPVYENNYYSSGTASTSNNMDMQQINYSVQQEAPIYQNNISYAGAEYK